MPPSTNPPSPTLADFAFTVLGATPTCSASYKLSTEKKAAVLATFTNDIPSALRLGRLCDTRQVVQFVVITRGATRVSELPARFQLDAMPGKQLSIDGDVARLAARRNALCCDRRAALAPSGYP